MRDALSHLDMVDLHLTNFDSDIDGSGAVIHLLIKIYLWD